jgi:hypothetical protein
MQSYALPLAMGNTGLSIGIGGGRHEVMVAPLL